MHEHQEQPTIVKLVSRIEAAPPPLNRMPGKNILLLDPRPVRHTERIADLFYVLFKRDN